MKKIHFLILLVVSIWMVWFIPCRSSMNTVHSGKFAIQQALPNGISWTDDFMTEPEQEDDVQHLVTEFFLPIQSFGGKSGFNANSFRTRPSIHLLIGSPPLYIMIHKLLI